MRDKRCGSCNSTLNITVPTAVHFSNLDFQFPLVLRDCGKLFTWKNLLAFFPVHLLAFHLSGVVYCITRPANVAQLYAIVTKQRYIFRGWGGGGGNCAFRGRLRHLIGTKEKRERRETVTPISADYRDTKTHWLRSAFFLKKSDISVIVASRTDMSWYITFSERLVISVEQQSNWILLIWDDIQTIFWMILGTHV